MLTEVGYEELGIAIDEGVVNGSATKVNSGYDLHSGLPQFRRDWMQNPTLAVGG
jgi:hypothetical protein